MELRTKLKYITIYIILNSIGIYLAFQNWWTTESPSPAPIFFLFFYLGICWIGTIFLAIMISILVNSKQNKNIFLSPFSLSSKESYEEYFGNESKRMRRSVYATSVGILLFSIFTFSFSMNLYKNYQFEKYGVIEDVRVSKILFDVKKNEYSFVQYGREKYSTTLLTKLFAEKKSVNENDSIKIIYSSENPKIVELYSNYKNKK